MDCRIRKASALLREAETLLKCNCTTQRINTGFQRLSESLILFLSSELDIPAEDIDQNAPMAYLLSKCPDYGDLLLFSIEVDTSLQKLCRDIDYNWFCVKSSKNHKVPAKIAANLLQLTKCIQRLKVIAI